MEGKLSQLFENFLNNQCAEEEIIALLKYFKIDEEESMLRELIMKELQRSGEPNIRIDRIQERLDLAYANVRQHIDQPPVPVIKKVKLWPRIASAAAVLLILSTGLFFYFNKQHTNQFVIVKNDIPPGGNKAALTLANGSIISLSGAANEELARQNGIRIQKTNDGQLVYSIADHAMAPNGNIEYNTIQVPNGGQYQVNLSDGTRIWLNSASSLKFPVTFSNLKERKVSLSGEAYFEVAKNKEMPFRVLCDNQIVEVLGTHFNINSYPGEAKAKTTLLEGSVRVGLISNNRQNKEELLRPGQQSIVRQADITVREADLDEAIAWKKGEFMFVDQPLEDIMKSISRWYNVTVEYEDPQIKRETFGGTISRFDKVSKVLNMLQLTGNVHFKIEGRRITVME